MPSITVSHPNRPWPSLLTWALVIGILLCGSLVPSSLRAQQAMLRFEPDDLQLRPGDEATIELWLDDIDDLYGLDLRFSFDPAVIKVLDDNSAVDGIQVEGGAFPYPDFEVKNAVSDDEAQIWYAVTQLNPRDPVNGSGMVLAIRIKAVGSGVCYLDVQYAKFVNRDGLEIDVQSSSGEVRVSSSSGETMPPPPTRTSTATATGLPSATPTHTATPTVEGVVALPTNTPLPAATPTASGGYLNPTSQPVLPSATSSGPTDPYAAPTSDQQATRAPRPTFTLTLSGETLPGATPPGAYPPPDATVAVVATAQGSATDDPFGMPTDTIAAAPRSSDARVAMAMPTLEKLWPKGEARQEQPDPLVPRETFICLSAGLVVLTLLLALYIWRRDRIGARHA